MTDTQPMTADEARARADKLEAMRALWVSAPEGDDTSNILSNEAATLRAYAGLLDRNNVQELHITPDVREAVRMEVATCHDGLAPVDETTSRIIAIFQRSEPLSAAVDETIAMAAEATREPDDVREWLHACFMQAIHNAKINNADAVSYSAADDVLNQADRILALRGGAKALEWGKNPRGHHAYTPFGIYTVLKNGQLDSWVARDPQGDNIGPSEHTAYPTLEAAKAAAERHWQQAYREAGE